MRLDHVVVFGADPPATAARIADGLGLPWADGGASESGYRSALVFLGDGLYLDVLAPLPDSAGPGPDALRTCGAVDGQPLAWVIETAVGRRLADDLGLSWEVEPGPAGGSGGFVGWAEAVGSGGLQPCFVQLPPGMLDRATRAASGWGAADGAATRGLEAITLSGDAAAQERVSRLLARASALTGDAVAALDVELRWVAGPPGLRAVTVRTTAGPVDLRGGSSGRGPA